MLLALCHLSASPDRVRHQHRDRHRTDTAGNGSDRGRFFRYFGKGNITNEPVTTLHRRVIYAIDSDIDHDRAVPDMFRANKFRLADGGDEDVSRARDIRQPFAA